MILFNSDGFLNEVMPDLPGCEVPMAANAIRNASIEFLERSNNWRATLDPIYVMPGTATYAIAQPASWVDPASNGMVYSAMLSKQGAPGDIIVSTTSGSPVVTLPAPSLTGWFAVGQAVLCDGFVGTPAILSIDATLGTITLDSNATADSSIAVLEDAAAAIDDGFDDVDQIEAEGRILLPKPTDWLDWWNRNWRTSSDGGVKYYTQPDQDHITLAAVPDQNAILTLQVSLKPKREATGIPDVVFQTYLEEIAAGAKARLMIIPGKPWSNPQTSAYYLGMFERGISAATAEADTGFTRAPIRTKSQF